MENRILNAVSEVTEIPIDDIKSNNKYLDVVRARMMYYYLCNEKNIFADISGAAVNRSASASSQGAISFKMFLAGNGKYRKLTEDVNRVLLGIGIGEQREWSHHEGRDYIYVGGKMYSILDVSSRYFGKGYMGFVNDEFVLYSDNKEKITKGLTQMANK